MPAQETPGMRIEYFEQLIIKHMKRSVLISAIAIGIYYLLREILATPENTQMPGRKHLTNAFSKAKEHAMNAAEE